MAEKKVKALKEPKAPKQAVEERPSVTFPDGREQYIDELNDNDVQQIQQIIRAAVEDVIKGSAAGLDKMLNPFGLACKVIAFTYPMGATKEEVDGLMLAAAGEKKNAPVDEVE